MTPQRMPCLVVALMTAMSCGDQAQEPAEDARTPEAHIPAEEARPSQVPETAQVENDLQSPAGLVLLQFDASDEAEYIFCQDGRIRVTYTENLASGVNQETRSTSCGRTHTRR